MVLNVASPACNETLFILLSFAVSVMLMHTVSDCDNNVMSYSIELPLLKLGTFVGLKNTIVPCSINRVKYLSSADAERLLIISEISTECFKIEFIIKYVGYLTRRVHQDF